MNSVRVLVVFVVFCSCGPAVDVEVGGTPPPRMTGSAGGAARDAGSAGGASGGNGTAGGDAGGNAVGGGDAGGDGTAGGTAGGAAGGNEVGGGAAGGSGGGAAGGSGGGAAGESGGGAAGGSGGGAAGGSGGGAAGGSGGGAGGSGPVPVVVVFSSMLNGLSRTDFTTNDIIFGRISGLTATAALGCAQPVGTTGCLLASAFQSLSSSGWAWDATSQLWRIQYQPGAFPQGSFEGFARNPATQVTSAATRLVVGPPSGSSASCATVPSPAGWVRSLTQTSVLQVQWVEIAGALWNPFPLSGGSGRLATTHGEYLALQFTTPSDPVACAAAQSKLFSWGPSQVDGEAKMNKTLISLSQCPGDFRFPTEAVAPVYDPTYARGCRNFRRPQPASPVSAQSNIAYRIGTGPSDEFTCELACGQTYFLNFVRVDPSFEGLRTPAQEIEPGFASNCETVHPNVTRCGVQLRYF